MGGFVNKVAILLLLGVVVGVYSASSSPYFTIYAKSGKYEIKNVNDPTGGVATAFYNASMKSTVCFAEIFNLFIVQNTYIHKGLGLLKY